jgi:hypothetical protein
MGKIKKEKNFLNHSSDPELNNFFISKDFEELEKDICHLQPLSLVAHRRIARKMHQAILRRIEDSGNENERSQLNRLADLIKMKVKLGE